MSGFFFLWPNNEIQNSVKPLRAPMHMWRCIFLKPDVPVNRVMVGAASRNLMVLMVFAGSCHRQVGGCIGNCSVLQT